MTYTTGNPERDKRLRRGIGEVVALHEQPTLEAVSAHVPKDFALDAEELFGMLLEMKVIEVETDAPEPPQVGLKPLIDKTPHGAPLPKSLEKIEALHAAEDEPPHNPPANTITEGMARTALNVANKRLEKARETMWLAQRALKVKRNDLAVQIQLWQLLFQPLVQTREQLVRETLAANQKLKQDIKDGKVAPPQMRRRGNGSYIDRVSGRGGGGDDFVRSHPVPRGLNGEAGQKGFRRGAFPSQFQHRKLPSQQ